MKKAWTIAIKDFKSYFNSPIAYIIIGGFLLIIGWMFFFNLSAFNMQNLQYKQYNMGKGVSITEGIIRPLYGNMNVILLFVIPVITMRLIAEEKKLHTIELLLTSPVTLTEIVLGKFMSAMMLVKVMILATCIYPAILFFTGNPDPGAIFASLIGTIFMAACYISIGLVFTAMTENQVVSGALTFASCLFSWLISWAGQSAGPVWSDLINHLSVISHFNNFSQGMIHTTDLVFYFSFIGFMLFLTHRILDSYRWRQ